MEYVGSARIGDPEHGQQVRVRIDDVEEPRWLALILDEGPQELAADTVVLTLVDEGLYEGWSGSAFMARGAGRDVLLQGRDPLTPPVGG